MELPLESFPCYPLTVLEDPKASAYTTWTAPASQDVPGLSQLNMDAPLTGIAAARQRAEESDKEVEAAQSFYVSRSSAASLRKFVK
jgi:hypothetical protein